MLPMLIVTGVNISCACADRPRIAFKQHGPQKMTMSQTTKTDRVAHRSSRVLKQARASGEIGGDLTAVTAPTEKWHESVEEAELHAFSLSFLLLPFPSPFAPRSAPTQGQQLTGATMAQLARPQTGMSSLGSPIPALTPHAVSVSLPKWADNVDYEEGRPRVTQAMQTGYPRFFIHRDIQKVRLSFSAPFCS